MDKHIKRQKRTALIMCILFIVVTFACLFYIEKELNHECNGEDCPVCAWNGSETTVLPNGKDEIKLADGKAVYVEDNYMSVI